MLNHKSQRQLQIAEQIKRIIAEIFLQDNPLPLPGVHITVVEADVSPDIKNAKIFINIFGSDEKDKLISKLNEIAPYLRSQLSKKIKIRHTPQLNFILDNVNEQASKINKLIAEEKKKFNN